MITLFFIMAICIYSTSATLSFSPAFKASPWFYVIGLTLSICANTIWLTIAKKTLDQSKLTIYGLYWDSIIVLSFILIPVLFFGVNFSKMQILGIALIIIGIFATKF